MSDEQAIRDLIGQWMDATKKGDTASVLDLMTDDVVFMTAGREPFGKEVFRAASAAMQGIKIDGEHRMEEVHVIGDHGWARIHLVVKSTMPGGKVIAQAGWNLTIFRKEKGAWKVARDANLLVLQISQSIR